MRQAVLWLFVWFKHAAGEYGLNKEEKQYSLKMSPKIPPHFNASLTDLACVFFFWFSRFEFAMKANDFLKDSTQGAKAEAGWKRLNEKLADGYVVTDLAAELLAANVQQPVVDSAGKDGVRWVNLNFRENDPALFRLTVTLRTVRNNLFHGGKSGVHGWADAERTSKLLLLGISILDELAIHADFQADYTGQY